MFYVSIRGAKPPKKPVATGLILHLLCSVGLQFYQGKQQTNMDSGLAFAFKASTLVYFHGLIPALTHQQC